MLNGCLKKRKFSTGLEVDFSTFHNIKFVISRNGGIENEY